MTSCNAVANPGTICQELDRLSCPVSPMTHRWHTAANSVGTCITALCCTRALSFYVLLQLSDCHGIIGFYLKDILSRLASSAIGVATDAASRAMSERTTMSFILELVGNIHGAE